jgi:hypothetical protein
MDDKNMHVQDGTITFPVWIKLVSVMVSAATAFAVPVGIWAIGTINTSATKLSNIELSIKYLSDDKYTATQASDAHKLLQTQIDALRDDVKELKAD